MERGNITLPNPLGNRLLGLQAVLKNNHIPWLGEAGNLQFRFDFINVLNHPNLGTVDPNMGDAGFGKVATALSARQLQLGVRLSF